MSYSLSNRGITNKDDKKQFASLKYCQMESDYCDFVAHFKTNFAIAHTFRNNERKKENLINFQYIAFDIDDNDVPMETFLTTLNLKPTISYTTTSNGIKGYRYRLVYCLDQPYQGKYYNLVYYYFYNSLGIILKDDCTKSANQVILGNGKPNIKMVQNDIVYSFTRQELEDLQDIVPLEMVTNKEKKQRKEQKESTKRELNYDGRNSAIRNNINIPPTTINCDGTINLGEYTLETLFQDPIYKDFEQMSFETFISTYNELYIGVRLESDLLVKDERVFLYPNEYTKVNRKFCYDHTKGEHYLGKWRDGEQRRKKLFLAGRSYLQCNPELTMGDLLFLLVREVVYYYDNKDKVFTKKFLCKKVVECFNSDLLVHCDHSNFRVNKAYCIANNIKPRALACVVRKEKHFEEIGELYDCSISDKENLMLMAEYGVKCSQRTLQRFKKENGISSQKGRPSKQPKELKDYRYDDKRIMEIIRGIQESEWETPEELNKKHNLALFNEMRRVDYVLEALGLVG